jgi:methylmalonyl-CoA/ethylmalonyl-CoA epimerase
MFGPIHHVGYIVRTIEPAAADFQRVGYRLVRPSIDDPAYDAEIVFLRREGAAPGEPLIELIRPRSEQSAVYAHTKESKLQIHHVCFAVDDLKAAVEDARRGKVYQLGAQRPAPAFDGAPICFLFSRPIGFFELVDRPGF